jgi:hypothetical protein
MSKSLLSAGTNYMKKQIMKKQSAALMIPLGALAVFGFPILVDAATIDAATCAQADVASAINSAARGDTVIVPAGTCAWSTSVSLSKGITLMGAGIDRTTITRSGVVIAVNPDTTAIANDDTIKINGFTFNGNNAALNLITVAGAGASGAKPFTHLIIGDNKFQNTSNTTSGSGVISTKGQVRGVIYHNTFDRCNVIAKVMGSDDTTEWANTSYNKFSYGSADNLYFEDNTILYSSTYSGGDPGWIESGQGARIVGRFNSWNLANASQQELWDIHGFQNWNGSVNSGQTGTMLVEYYNNAITNAGGYRWINHRGSWGMFFSNTATGSGGMSIDINQYAPGDVGGSGCAAQISPTPTYIPQVNNTYVFNNTRNGSQVVMNQGAIGDGCGTTVNNGYWNYTAAFNGAVGVGVGPASARPSTCTTGVGYWATDEGEWNSPHAGADGQFYKCTSTNTWALYYKPYTYPHPLRTGSPSVLAPPTNLSTVVQ